MKTNRNSTIVADDQGPGLPLNRRNFLKVVGGGIVMIFSESAWMASIGAAAETPFPLSDHFNGTYFLNPGSPSHTGDAPKRGVLGYLWQWMAGNAYPGWPEFEEYPPGQPPADRVPKGTLRIISIGHASFLIQMDELNILIDPVWAERSSPFTWVGPKRHSRPGLRLEDLPAIDAVLISHNHYDHLDFPTLEWLGKKGTLRCLVPLGNGNLVRDSGIPTVDELDWWQSARLSEDVTVTLVQAQHFSSRTLWDRNKALWGGFVISGPSGNIFFAGDTGYNTHFSEIARRFSPIRVAILPISPFQPKSSDKPSSHRLRVHMRSREAVKVHLDLGAQVSIAAHFRVFQLGPDGFDDAVQELTSTLELRNLKPDVFLALNPGQSYELIANLNEISSPVNDETPGSDKINGAPQKR
jgi:L-ascorbate metabolism protein UlaG (beta-lactamase superfamily)